MITNNHVIDQCDPNDKIKVLKDTLTQDFTAYVKEKGELPPPIAQKLSQDPVVLAKLRSDPEFVKEYVSRWIENLAKAGAPNITQKLFVAVMGKNGQSPIQVDVSNIVRSSWKNDEKARETGVDPSNLSARDAEMHLGFLLASSTS